MEQQWQNCAVLCDDIAIAEGLASQCAHFDCSAEET